MNASVARRALAALATVALVAGCGGRLTIQRLADRPAKYDGQRVTIVARVIETRDVPVVNLDYYKITDDTGTLWVMTRHGVPVKSLRYRITGRYERPASAAEGLLLGDYIIEEYGRTEIEPAGTESAR